MGAENYQQVSDDFDALQCCSIKKQWFALQQKIDEAKKVGQTTKRLWLKQKLFNEATKISKVILETHNEKQICKCFQTPNVQDVVRNIEEKNLQLMLDYLDKLSGFLGQLDSTDTACKKSEPSRKPLNPLSKCFVPKYLCITENPEFQSDNLPDILKDVNTVSKPKNEYCETSELSNSRSEACSVDTKLLYSDSNVKYQNNSVQNFPHYGHSFVSNFQKVHPIQPNISSSKNINANSMPKLNEVHRETYDKFHKFHRELKALWAVSDKVSISTRNDTESPISTPLSPIRDGQSQDKFKNNWSVRSGDQKLLNPRILLKPCGCPPCFGYNIPPNFWGNPFKLSLCAEREIHLSCYTSDCKHLKNIPPKVEILKTPDSISDAVEKRYTEAEKFLEFRLIKHKKDFQKFVSDVVCDITKVLDKASESDEEVPLSKNQSSVRFQDKKFQMIDESTQSNLPQGSSTYLSGIDKHDLLNGFSRCARLGQRCQKYPRSIRQLCNTPCSVWCDFNKDLTWGCNRAEMCNSQQIEHKTQTKNCSKPYELDGQIWHNDLHRTLQEKMFCQTTNNSEVASFLQNSVNLKNSPDDGDSGYDSGSVCSNNLSNDPNFESSFWTPLPDCISNTETYENIPTICEKSGNRPLKNQRYRTKRVPDEFVEQRSGSNIEVTKYKLMKLRSQQHVSRKLKKDFPVL